MSIRTSVKMMAFGIAVIGAAPVAAQQRGTVEFGGFAGSTMYDNGLAMNHGWGGGGRVGLFLAPRLSVEFEGGGNHSAPSLASRHVNVEVLSARLTAVPLKSGPASLLVGAGGDHTDTYMLESFGLHGLVGAKYALSNAVALRVDAIESYMLTGHFTNFGMRMGASVYLNPRRTNTVTREVTRDVPGPQRPDSVSAAETRRLRGEAANYEALRDSLARRTASTPSSERALATMQEMIYFPNDRSDLSDPAKQILADKVTVFRANPGMRIVIVGFASQPGTTDYNMALGLRRAEAAKAYLIAQGVDPIRIEIGTRGEGQLAVEGPGEAADAANRRGQFRLLIADPFLAPPTP